MVDLTNVILVIAAIVSAIFVALTEGFKLTLGFRGSEETRTRKQRIDNSLHTELDGQIEDFMTSEASRGGNPDRIIGIRDLGFKTVVAYEITNDLITGADKFMKRAFLWLFAAIAIMSVTILEAFTVDLSQPTNLIILIAYTIITAYLLLIFIRSTLKSLRFREEFVKLDDEPTLEHGCKLTDQLW